MNSVVGLLIMLLFGIVGIVRYAYGPEYAEAVLVVSALSISVYRLLDHPRLQTDLPPTETGSARGD